jgi:hypothetical protein
VARTASLPAPDTRSDRLSPAALGFFFKIAALWGLAAADQRILLGALPESTLYSYRSHPERARLSRDQLDRISHLVGIYKALNVLLPRPEAADAWVKRPNAAPLFGGRSALEVMRRGGFEDIAAVRYYLDGQRGW